MKHMTALETEGGFIRVSGTEKRVCEDISRRQVAGIQKYGTTVEENPLTLREFLNHQYEELLDAAIYCRRAIEIMDKDGEGGR